MVFDEGIISATVKVAEICKRRTWDQSKLQWTKQFFVRKKLESRIHSTRYQLLDQQKYSYICTERLHLRMNNHPFSLWMLLGPTLRKTSINIKNEMVTHKNSNKRYWQCNAQQTQITIGQPHNQTKKSKQSEITDKMWPTLSQAETTNIRSHP